MMATTSWSRPPRPLATIQYADIEFTISAGHVDGDIPYLNTLSGTVTSGTATFTAVVNDGSLSTDVVNNSGAQLPSTGGIGTTIFYVLGSVLVIGAGLCCWSPRSA
ncbi:MAG: LPXTG cell wall anchor domain-containing protein [Oscillospiraceae bacterium]